MMNFDETSQEQDLLAQLVHDLDDKEIRARIEQPILDAAAEFFCEKYQDGSYREFLEVLRRFLQWLDKKGLYASLFLDEDAALSEAVHLLESGYRSVTGTGFNAAAVDACSTKHDGVECVLQQLTEIIREKQRQKYIQYQIAKHLAPLDWQTKKRIAAVMLETYRRSLSSTTADWPPSQWAESIPQLIFMQSNTNHLLDQLFS